MLGGVPAECSRALLESAISLGSQLAVDVANPSLSHRHGHTIATTRFSNWLPRHLFDPLFGSLKYIPFFGWGMWLMGMILIKRNWNKDQVWEGQRADICCCEGRGSRRVKGNGGGGGGGLLPLPVSGSVGQHRECGACRFGVCIGERRHLLSWKAED